MYTCETCRMAYCEDLKEDRQSHQERHDEIVNGVPSKTLKDDVVLWRDNALKITVVRHWNSSLAQRKLADRAVLRATFDVGFGTSPYDVDEEDEENTNPQLFLLHRENRIIGTLVLRMRGYVGSYTWEEYDQSNLGDLSPSKPIPSISSIWTLERYRRNGLASLLISKAAEKLGTEIPALSWYTPFTEGGERLARNLCPTSFYIAK